MSISTGEEPITMLTTCLLNSRMSRRNFCARSDYACEASKTWNDQHVPICFHDRTLHILYRALLDDFCTSVQESGEPTPLPNRHRPSGVFCDFCQMVDNYTIREWTLLILGADVIFFLADCVGQVVLV